MSAPYPSGPDQHRDKGEQPNQYGFSHESYGIPPGYPQTQGAQGYPQGYSQGGYPQQQQPGYGASPQQQQGPAVIQTQPQGALPGSAPPGLEYLSMLDQILVKQKVEILEAFTGFETKNKYDVLNVMGQPIFKAKEDTDCCSRNICGPCRSFDMEIVDNFGHEVIHLNRPLRCDSCCFPCCLQELEVSSPPGNVIGKVVQNWSILFPKFSVKDEAGNVVFKIKGPFCTCSICGDVDFEVETPDGQPAGKISKQWSGIGREAFTDADNFGISFPKDTDVKMKAVLLGACFLIDFMFFEKSGNNERDRPGMFD